MKNFFGWLRLKRNIDESTGRAFAHPREIWWCSLGINVGVEIDGKHENFERPVIIVRVYNKHSLLILPLTGKEKNDNFHYMIKTKRKTVWVKLTQVRMISNKRLLRKIDIVDTKQFSGIRQALRTFI